MSTHSIQKEEQPDAFMPERVQTLPPADANVNVDQGANTQQKQQDAPRRQPTRAERKRRFREEQQAAQLASIGTIATTTASSATTSSSERTSSKKPLRMPASAFLPLHALEQPPLLRRCVVSYDGANFTGFQAQDRPDTMRTVQETIEDALLRTTSERTRLRAASRTDAGVHALGQVIAFTSRCSATNRAFRDALNSRLPDDVVCRALMTLAHGDTFDPRAHSKRKTYVYRLAAGGLRPVLDRQRVWHVKTRLDVALMRAACVLFTASPAAKDYSSFTSQKPVAGAAPDAHVCALASLDVIETSRAAGDDSYSSAIRGDGVSDDGNADDSDDISQQLQIVVTGDRFLYKMVRNIVGTLVDVGRGRLAPERIPAILAAKNRALAGQGAPPHGLTLVHIAYDDQ